MDEKITLKKRIAALEQVARFVDSVRNLKQLLSDIMRVSTELLNAEASSLMLYDSTTRELYFEVALGEKSGKVRSKRIKLSQGIAGHAAATGQVVNVQNVYTDKRFYSGLDQKSGFKTTSILAVPLKRKERLIGVLEILNKKGGKPFRKDDIALAKIIASQAAVVIENAQLYADNLKAERMAAIGQTIAGVSHDIKNILAGLQGGVELVDMGFKMENEKTLTDGWKMIKGNIGKVSDLVLDMLNYSRQKGPNLRPTDLSQLVNDVVQLYSEKTAEKKASFNLNLDKQIDKIMLDPAGMERVILNLVNNSFDALPEKNGCITIQTSLSGKNILFSIGDNGCGIPADKIDQIFGLFFTTKGSKGTGIGLAVVHKIIKEHHGRISVRSKPGEGTIFSISLPYRTPGETKK